MILSKQGYTGYKSTITTCGEYPLTASSYSLRWLLYQRNIIINQQLHVASQLKKTIILSVERETDCTEFL